jgi:hypothetical protein
MFRLVESRALINRLGFNNDGLDAFVANVKRARSFRARGGIVGLNIGKNAATPIERAADDYLLCLAGVYPHADYVAVNVSSPNTKNLRALQSDDALDALLAALQERRRKLMLEQGRTVPMFLKIAPDLDAAQVAAIAATLQRHAIDGVIATNTTISRRPAPRRRGRRPERRAAARSQQCRDPPAAVRARPRLPDHRRRRRDGANRGASQDRRRRRPGADLHRVDLRWAGGRPRCRAGARHAALCSGTEARGGAVVAG